MEEIFSVLLTDAIYVAAGGAHSAAIRSNGSLVLWGRNEFGESNVPFGLGPVVAVSLGYSTTIVKTANGEFLCWGSDSFGECSPPATKLQRIDMSAGGRHMLYLLEDGSVTCLGYACSVPDGLTGVTSIDAGADQGIALMDDGTVVCVAGGAWTCAPAASISDAVAAAAGWGISAVVRANGSVAVWGPPAGAAAPPALLPAVGVSCSYGSVAIIEVRDCNRNGIDDVEEILADPTRDCNGNFTLDECEREQQLRSRATFPFGNGHPHTFNAGVLPHATGPVSFTVRTRANLAGLSRFVTAKLNGAIITTLFVESGSDCEVPEQVATFELTAAAFNALLASGTPNTFRLEAAGTVAPGACELTWAMIELSYPIEPDRPDCTGSGNWDACDIQSGLEQDCNRNGIPDSCETLIDCDGDGVADACQILADPGLDLNGDGILDACSFANGDFNLDGIVDGADLGVMLALWGLKNPEIGDLNGDGVVDGADLAVLLGNWGVLKW